MRHLLAALPLALSACAAARAPAVPPARLAVSQQIVTQDRDASEPELFARAERELHDEQWQAAKRDFELLAAVERAADHGKGARPSSSIFPTVLFDLGTTYEALAAACSRAPVCDGSGDRTSAARAYHELAEKFPALPSARLALVRCVWLESYLEAWKPLGATGEALLARPDLDPLDRMAALAARGLSRAELGQTDLALVDIEKGIDIMEDWRVGMTGKLPPAGAALKFALAEARRIDTEKIALLPSAHRAGPGWDGSEFVAKVSARCAGLLEAQRAYADAMRTTDPHFAMMAGYRLGAMYDKLHAELMSIPPDGFAKNEHQRQIFYGIMHVRYRALLDKALIMLNATLDVADKLGDRSPWVERGRAAKAEMERDLADEKATLARFPFTEEELEKALRIMQEKADQEMDRTR